MNNWKQITALLLALLMLFSLAACGRGANEDEPEEDRPSGTRRQRERTSAPVEEHYDEESRTLSYTGGGLSEGDLYMRVPAEDEIVTATDWDESVWTYVDGELLVISRDGVGYDEMSALFARYEMDIVGCNALGRSYQIRSRHPLLLEELRAAIADLESEDPVAAVSLNTVSDLDLGAYALPNDPWDGEAVSATAVGGSNWGVEAIRAPWFWQNYDLRGVRVGVVDNMFAEDHRDLSFAAIYHNNYSAKADRWYHGTHVSGIIGATYNNRRGLCGVLKDPLLFATDYSASEFQENGKPVHSLYAYHLKIGLMLLNQARVINFSLGYGRKTYFENGGTPESLYWEAVNDGAWMSAALQVYLDRGQDFLLVCSAGNNNIDAFDNWWTTAITDEAVKSRIVVVGAAEQHGDGYGKCDFSNYGPRVDVVAPGANIYSCIKPLIGTSDYDACSGTSMAAPHVTAACAALWAYYPALSGADVKALLVETAGIPVSGFEVKMIDLQSAFGGMAEGELRDHERMNLEQILAAYGECANTGPRLGLSDLTVYAGHSLSADVDFDGLQDRVSVSGSARLALSVDFGSGESWQADMSVDSAGQTPYARLLSFTDGDLLCYAFISENFGSRYGGLYCDLYGQDYLHGGSVVPLEQPYAMELDSYGGVYEDRWVVVVNTVTGDFSQVYGIPEPLYGDLTRMAADYGEPVLPIPYADGMCYEIYARPRSDGQGYELVLSQSCSSQLGFLECPGTVFAAYRMRDDSHSRAEQVWFEEDSAYLYPLSGVTPAMVSRDLPAAVPASGVADGQYWAILYAEDDASGSRVSTEVDLEDYMCFSYEEIAALQRGDTLEMSRFIPIWLSIETRAYGGFSDGYEDVTVESIDRDSSGWLGDTLYVNRGSWNQVILQNWNGCWRVAAEEDYIPMQFLRTVTLSFSPDVRIYDQLTPLIIPPSDGSSVIEWSDPYDFFVFNYDMRYFEAQITVKNGVITEMTIPYRP